MFNPDPPATPEPQDNGINERNGYTITDSGRAVIEEFLSHPENQAWHDQLDTTPITGGWDPHGSIK